MARLVNVSAKTINSVSVLMFGTYLPPKLLFLKYKCFCSKLFMKKNNSRSASVGYLCSICTKVEFCLPGLIRTLLVVPNTAVPLKHNLLFHVLMAEQSKLFTFLAYNLQPNSFIKCFLFLKIIFDMVLTEDKSTSRLTVFEGIRLSVKFFLSCLLTKPSYFSVFSSQKNKNICSQKVFCL